MKKKNVTGYIVIEVFPEFESQDDLLEEQRKAMSEMIMWLSQKKEENLRKTCFT